jgi:UDP-N-acetylmuramoyl-tripeptide--D-alanyl-D-alanine ligase
VTVVNDAYNANPESVRAALQTLARMAHAGDGTAGRRSWAVLGEMAELGAETAAAHRAVGEAAASLGVDRLLAVGETAAPTADAASAVPGWTGRSEVVADIAAAAALLGAELRPGDLLLIKASRAVGLERLAARLLEEPGEKPA